MNLLLAALDKVCRRNLLQEKILVVPSYQCGHVLFESLAQAGTGWVNLRPETPAGLALRAAGEQLAARRISLLPGYLSKIVAEEILLKSYDEGELRYFSRENITPGLAAALSSAFLELRLYAVSSDALLDEYFICPEKGRDMKLLFKQYEDYLLAHRSLDYPGLISSALTAAPERPAASEGSIYLAPSFYRWKPLEEKLIRVMAGDSLISLPAETTAETPFAIDGEVSFFHAYGLVNELREVLRQVQAGKIPFDQVAVAYTNDQYIAALYSLSRSLGLEITVFEGIPAALTAPGRALRGIASWIKSGFSGAVLSGLGESGDLVPRCEDREIRAPERASLGGGASIESLLGQLPGENTEGKASFSDFCTALAEMLPALCGLYNDLDDLALAAITSSLQQIAALSSLELSLEEAAERALAVLDVLRVGNSGPKPGRLHLTSYQNLIWSGRPHTFVAGLDAGSFPGAVRQDAVLLDSERMRIDAALPLGSGKLEDKRFDMRTALSSRRGRLVLSYPSFDVVQGQELYPASLLLHLYRLQRKEQTLGYSDLLDFLGQPAGYCGRQGEDFLDEAGWWIGRAAAGKIEGSALIEDCYGNVKRAQTAARSRQEREPTVYDGALCRADTPRPSWIAEGALSCSRLEYLAACPFGYFLKYVLQLELPQEALCDPSGWLDPLQRGTLLHSLFCNFMRKITKAGERADPEKHQVLLHEIALPLIAQYKEKTPPPSELVFQSEVSEILESGNIFLTMESRRDSLPLFFEVPFGLGAKEAAAAGCGLAAPVRLDLGRGRELAFWGRIDRIDQIGKGLYSVWDYKTGSSRDYRDEQYFNKGRQLQHALYAVAAEEFLKTILPDEPLQVVTAGYFFPSRRGEGRQVERDVKNRDQLFSLLNTMYEILESGTFVASHDNTRCGYCDYAAVCGEDAAAQRAKRIFADAARLDPWRRLQQYD